MVWDAKDTSLKSLKADELDILGTVTRQNVFHSIGSFLKVEEVLLNAT